MLANPQPRTSFDVLNNTQLDRHEFGRQQVLFKVTGESTSSASAKSEILQIVLNGGGPKWGFRIRLLNDDRVIVSRINNKGPADKSGLKVNDEIITVNNIMLDSKPRSLLLYNQGDYEPQRPTGYATEGLDVLKDTEGSNEQQISAPLFHTASFPMELSKLDFTYQLIRHSSLSNKLILSVRRYLNAAYARASVAASNYNPDEQQPLDLNPVSVGGNNKKAYNLSGMHYAYKCCECYCNNDNDVNTRAGELKFSKELDCERRRDELEELSRTDAERGMDEDTVDESVLEESRYLIGNKVSDRPVTKRAYVETSLDNLSYSSSTSSSVDIQQQLSLPQDKASELSADEEDEKRLLLQLQNEHRNKQLQLAQEQNKLQQAYLEQTQRESASLKNLRQQQVSDDEAPQVPMRKSSRTNACHRSTYDEQQTDDHRRESKSRLMQRTASTQGFELDQLPKPLLFGRGVEDDDYDDYEENEEELDWAATQAAVRHPRNLRTILSSSKRPTQPPPPPPPGTSITRNEQRDEEPHFRKPPKELPPLPVDPWTRSLTNKKSAPRNIWSPSTSSAEVSGSCNDFEDEESNSLNASASGTEKNAENLLLHLQRPLLADLSSSSPQTQENTIIDQLEYKLAADLVEAQLIGPNFANNNKNNNINNCCEKTATNEKAETKNEAQAEESTDTTKLGEVSSVGNKQLIGKHQQPDGEQRQEEAGTTNKAEPGDESMTLEHQTSSTSVVDCGNNSNLTDDVAVAAPSELKLQGESNERNCLETAQLATTSAPPSARVWPARASTVGNTLVDRSSEPLGGIGAKGRSFSIGSNTNPTNNNINKSLFSMEPTRAWRLEQTQNEREEEEELRKYWTLPANHSSNQANELIDNCSKPNMRRIVKDTTITRRELRESFSSVIGDARLARQQPAAQSKHDEFGQKGPTAREQFRVNEQQREDSSQLQQHACSSNNTINNNINNNNSSEDQHRVRMKNSPFDEKVASEQYKKQDLQQTNRDEWFRQMYKQMHKQSPEKTLFQTINSQPDNTQIRIKLKSPRPNHRSSPSYYSEEDYERKAFKPGNISDYLPGQSSISQHERNLNIYYQLIDHIDRVFSSVLLEAASNANSRSTFALHRLGKNKWQQRHSSGPKLKKRQLQQSRSGPQTPVSTRCYREPLKMNQDERQTSLKSLFREHASDQELSRRMENYRDANRLEDESNLELEEDNDQRKQYIAVQQGLDIPLKGLRKPAPQANHYQVGHYARSSRDGTERHLNSSPVISQICWPEDIYRDFESVYESMVGEQETINDRHYDSNLIGSGTRNLPSTQPRGKQFDNAIFDTQTLIKSLNEVEQNHRQQMSGNNQVSPSECYTYGKVDAINTGGIRSQPSPLSIGASEQTRASSRNTNQSYVSQMGPALVEEMTLSDLEDEISSSLMASKESSSKYINRHLYASSIDRIGFGSARNRGPINVASVYESGPSSAFFRIPPPPSSHYSSSELKDMYPNIGPSLQP